MISIVHIESIRFCKIGVNAQYNVCNLYIFSDYGNKCALSIQVTLIAKNTQIW